MERASSAIVGEPSSATWTAGGTSGTAAGRRCPDRHTGLLQRIEEALGGILRRIPRTTAVDGEGGESADPLAHDPVLGIVVWRSRKVSS